MLKICEPRLTFPDPVDPATASNSPFTRLKLMLESTGVTCNVKLLKIRFGSSLEGLPPFLSIAFSKTSPKPCMGTKKYINIIKNVIHLHENKRLEKHV